MNNLYEEKRISGNNVSLRMENENFVAIILPGDGGRIVSFIHKPSGRDFIWTNARTSALTRVYGANYDNLSAGGIEEAFPTGYADNYNGDEFPFFGEVWPIAWDYTKIKDGFRLEAYCSIYAVKLCKQWILADNGLICEYELKNLCNAKLPYLFGVHPSLRVLPGDRLGLPEGEYETGPMFPEGVVRTGKFVWPKVRSGSHISGNRDLSVPAGENTCEYMNINTLNSDNGNIHLKAEDEGVVLRIRYDAGYFTSLGAWLIYGGWRGHRCVMLEFFTGWPLKLSESVDTGKCVYLNPKETMGTRVSYEISHS